jgi:hypothetical protein
VRKTDQRYASAGALCGDEGGMWEPPGDPSKTLLRHEFWRAARRVCPSAFAALAEIEVPPAIAARWAAYLGEEGWELPALATEPDAAAFERALGEWACEYRIARPDAPPQYEPRWWIELARETRLAWAAGVRSLAQLDVEPLGLAVERASHDPPVALDPRTGQVVARGPEPEAPPGPFDPSVESIDSYTERCRSYARRVVARLERAGWRRAPRYTPEHLEWLARSRLAGESSSRIARGARVPPHAVRMAVARAAQQLGLPPLSR